MTSFEPSTNSFVTTKFTKVENAIEGISLFALAHCFSLKATGSILSIDTRIGGLPYQEIGESWPTCTTPTCHKRHLTFVFQFRDPDVDELYTFYYCSQCKPTGQPNESGQWVIRNHYRPSLKYCHSKFPVDIKITPMLTIEGILQFISGPSWGELDSEHKHIANHFKAAYPTSPIQSFQKKKEHSCCNLSPIVAHLVTGGHALWYSRPIERTCPCCGSKTEHIAQLKSIPGSDVTWPFESDLYISRCPSHTHICQIAFQGL